MKESSNKDVLNVVRQMGTEEFQEKIPMITGDDIGEIQSRAIYNKIQQYPTLANEFMNILINKVVKTDFFNRVFSNPLKMFKKENLTYGSTIEEIFVEYCTQKGFYGSGSNYNDGTGGNTINQPESSELWSTELTDIKKLYVSVNFAEVFPLSISDIQLRKAFFNENGLSKMINNLMSALASGVEIREYKQAIELLKYVALQKQPITDGKGNIQPVNTTNATGEILAVQGMSQSSIRTDDQKRKFNGVIQTMYKYNIDSLKGSKIAGVKRGEKVSMAIRTLAGRLKFPSTKYNMAGVSTFTPSNELVFLTTPEIEAELDVTVLAHAFNVSNADVKVRTIVVDELPTKWYRGRKLQSTIPGEGVDEVGYYYRSLTTDSSDLTSTDTLFKDAECLGILMDSQFIDIRDSVNESRTQENGRALSRKIFMHKQGMLSNCFFANCVALFEEAEYNKVKPHAGK